MNKSDFYFDLPEELIAQTPIKDRTASRLMLLSKSGEEPLHKHFYDIVDLLKAGDVLVLNDSRVIPARLKGQKIPTGSPMEFMLLKNCGSDIWEVMVRPGKKAKPGARFAFGPEGELVGEITQVLENGNRLAHFEYEGEFMSVLSRVGEVPLPHYITHKLQDPERYQTAYSRVEGSAAAPTAGLHFTGELLEKISEKGVKLAYVTLHVGLGTFRPVKTENILDHKMHSEFFVLPEETAQTLNSCRASGGRIVAVGTTGCRTLESAAGEDGRFEACSGETDIFIYPGYKFKAVDALITNFHLPESTLIMLVSALAGHENIMNAYRTAVKEEYRFYSFGDAMFIE